MIIFAQGGLDLRLLTECDNAAARVVVVSRVACSRFCQLFLRWLPLARTEIGVVTVNR